MSLVMLTALIPSRSSGLTQLRSSNTLKCQCMFLSTGETIKRFCVLRLAEELTCRPYPVHVEKRVHVPVKVPVPTPVEVIKKVRTWKLPEFLKLFHSSTKVPYVVEKPVPYHVHVPVDRPVLHERIVPFPVHQESPVAVKVPVHPPQIHHHQHEHEHYPESNSYTNFSGYGSEYSYHH